MDNSTKYTPVQEKELVQRYQRGESVQSLASYFDKSTKSIIAKLSRLGIYRARVSKPRFTKLDMLAEIEVLLNLDPKSLQSLEKGDKSAIEQIYHALSNKLK